MRGRGVVVVRALVFSTVTALVAVARPAFAQPATANRIQAAAGGLYGVALNDVELNPWGFGLGLGVGYTLPIGAYGGAGFEYFFGSEEASAGFEGSANLWDLMAELGYDLGVGSEVVLRGKGDIGVASVMADGCVTTPLTGQVCSSSSDTALVLGPGAAFLYLGKSFSFTFDARYDIVFAPQRLHGLIFTVGIGF